MPERNVKKPEIKILIFYSLLLAASFIFFDRLLFLALREAAAHFYVSMKTDEFPWLEPEGSGNGQILILGTSRSYYGFDDDVLSSILKAKIYKQAQPGNYPQYNYYFYQKYKTTFPKPRLVIYGLDYFIFERESINLELVRLDNTIQLKKMNPQGVSNPSSPWLSRASWLYRLKPKTDEFIADLWKFDRKPEEAEVHPAASQPGKEKKLELKRKSRRGMPRGAFGPKPRTWPKSFYHSFPGEEGVFLKRLLDELDQDGVPAFLVFIPEYIGSYETNFEQEKFKRDIRQLVTPYEKLRVLDFNNLEKFDLNNSRLFWNGGWGVSNSHLNDKGARLFSRKLAMDMKRILKSDQPARGPKAS
jgi:hypothetical protein